MPSPPATLPSPCPQVASPAWPEAASFSRYLVLPGHPWLVLPLLLPPPASGPHSLRLSHCPPTLPLLPSLSGISSDPDPGLTDLLLKLTLISSWQWWFSRSCRRCSLGGWGEGEDGGRQGLWPPAPPLCPTHPGPHGPSRSPEKLTGSTMPTERTPTTTSSPMMCLWKDR